MQPSSRLTSPNWAEPSKGERKHLNHMNRTACRFVQKTLPTAILLAFFALTPGISAQTVLKDLTPPPSKELSKLQEKTLRATYETRRYTLLHHPNHSGSLHVTVGTNGYRCQITSGPLFPLPDELKDVEITKVNVETRTEIISRKISSERKAGAGITYDTVNLISYFWEFSLKHPHLGRGEIMVTKENGELPDNLEEVADVLGYVLKGEGLKQPKRYAANTLSKVLHYSACGHLPEAGSVEYADRPEDAQSNGYKKCPLCFNNLVYLSHLSTELSMGKEAESSVRHYYQIDKSTALQDRVDAAGRRVLAKWPHRLKGYSYRFQVLDDDDFNASACPTGFVFLNRGLVEALESEDELEAVLAHEISHVELRHGLMEYLKAQRDAQNAAIFATIVTVGAAAGSANSADSVLITSAAGTVSALLANLAAQVSLIGYSKDHEIQSDVFSLMYLQSQGKSREILKTVLKKIRSSQEVEESIAGAKLVSTTHPKLNERLFIAESLEVRPATSMEVYDAFDKNGEVLYSFTFQAQAIYTKRDGKKVHIILGELQATPAIGEPKLFENVRIMESGKPKQFKTDGKTLLAPLDTLGVAIMRTDVRADFLAADGISLSIEGISAERVEKRNSVGTQ